MTAVDREPPFVKSSITRLISYPNQHSSIPYNDSIENTVVGIIEGESTTVSGGLLSACCESFNARRSYCLLRTSENNRLITIVDGDRCECCIRASTDESVKVNSLRFGNGSCFREIYNISFSKADKLAGLITELVRFTDPGDVKPKGSVLQVTGALFTVSNVTHLSHRVLHDLLTFDPDFFWGDNLVFNATV